jgi:hypothetical protein
MSNGAFSGLYLSTNVVTVITSTSTNEQKLQIGAKIYSTGRKVVVSLPETIPHAIISVYDLNGRLIVSKQAETGLTEIPIHKNGIYLVRLIDGSQVQTAKILIK